MTTQSPPVMPPSATREIHGEAATTPSPQGEHKQQYWEEPHSHTRDNLLMKGMLAATGVGLLVTVPWVIHDAWLDIKEIFSPDKGKGQDAPLQALAQGELPHAPASHAAPEKPDPNAALREALTSLNFGGPLPDWMAQADPTHSTATHAANHRPAADGKGGRAV